MLSQGYLAIPVPVDPVKHLPWSGRYFCPLKYAVAIFIPRPECTFFGIPLHRVGKRIHVNSADEQKRQSQVAQDGSTHVNIRSVRLRTESLELLAEGAIVAGARQ